jgi:hypothetical protein
LSGIHGEGKITLAKWLHTEVGDDCALNGSAWFMSGATSDRSDSTLLIPTALSQSYVTFNLLDRILARNSHMFTESDGHLHLLFGAVRKELLNDMWRYDESAESSTRPDLNHDRIRPRKGHSCVCVGNMLYAFRGKTEGASNLRLATRPERFSNARGFLRDGQFLRTGRFLSGDFFSKANFSFVFSFWLTDSF